jgi:hypothetical protein
MNKPLAWINAQDLLDMQANALVGKKEWSLNVGLVEQKGDVPLFTAPQRKWVGMTEDEALELLPEGDWEIESTLDFAQAIEAKLKDKNGF